MTEYDIVYADPPWKFKIRSPKGDGRSASQHYPLMTLDDIKRLPVPDLSAKNSVLFLWATDPMLLQALDVVRHWGFTYKTVGFYWVKTNADGNYWMGLGYYTRANPELCLLATRGDGLRRISKNVRRLVVAPRGRHSAKPPEVRQRIVDLFGSQRRVELFAREQVPGFAVWGDQVESTPEVASIIHGVTRNLPRSVLDGQLALPGLEPNLVQPNGARNPGELKKHPDGAQKAKGRRKKS